MHDDSSSKARVLFEDEHCVIVDKPACMHSVRSSETDDAPSVALFLAREWPAMIEASPKVTDCGLVQRLDFETSGVLAAAKSRRDWEALYEALTSGRVQKSYIVIADGLVTTDTLEARTLLGSRYRRSTKVQVFESELPKGARGLPAQTRYERLALDTDRTVSLLRAVAPTARRHQVRAHAAWLGHPLTGDAKYGSHRSLEEVAGVSAPPFCLHAERIAFDLWGRRYEIEAPRPAVVDALFEGVAA